MNKGRSSPTGEVLTVGSPKGRSKRSRSSAPEEVRKGKEEVLTRKGGPDGWISKGEVQRSRSSASEEVRKAKGEPHPQRRSRIVGSKPGEVLTIQIHKEGGLDG